MVGADGFEVRPDDLRGMGKALVVLSAYLDSTRSIVDGLSPGQFGDERLGEATRSFVSDWKWQADRIGTALVEASSRLMEAAANYEKVEDAQLRAEGLR